MRRPASATPFDAAALAASAGGYEAMVTVLRHLSASFPAAVVIAQHLPANSRFADMLERRPGMPVVRARSGMALAWRPEWMHRTLSIIRCRVVRT